MLTGEIGGGGHNFLMALHIHTGLTEVVSVWMFDDFSARLEGFFSFQHFYASFDT